MDVSEGQTIDLQGSTRRLVDPMTGSYTDIVLAEISNIAADKALEVLRKLHPTLVVPETGLNFELINGKGNGTGKLVILRSYDNKGNMLVGGVTCRDSYVGKSISAGGVVTGKGRDYYSILDGSAAVSVVSFGAGAADALDALGGVTGKLESDKFNRAYWTWKVAANKTTTKESELSQCRINEKKAEQAFKALGRPAAAALAAK